MPIFDRRSFMATSAFLGLSANQARAASTLRFGATQLRTAMRKNPIGIDDRHPSLSWRVAGPDETMQSAYRILVASSSSLLGRNVGDIWDSGRIEGAACTGIQYEGRPLRSRETCHWKVQVWNEKGNTGWSDPAYWEMGLLEAKDWTGDWLAAEDAVEREDRLSGVQWVGGNAPAPDKPRSFRLAFRSDAGDALLTIFGDGVMSRLELDGKPLALPARDPNAFGGAPATRLALQLPAGDHLLSLDIAPAPGFFIKPFVSIAGQIRLPALNGSSKRLSGNWETRLGEAENWVVAPLLDTQPIFPWPPTPARLLRRRFSNDGAIVQARLYAAALGGYRLSLNGRRVNDDELQAEPVNYAVRIPYRAYDVTDLIQKGTNCLGAVIGDGYYASYQAPDGRYAFGSAPRRLQLMLELTRFDGSIERIITDNQWRHARAPILMSEIYAGEDQDLRSQSQGWDRPDFDDSKWDRCWTAPTPIAPISAALAEPVRIIRQLPPVAIRKLGDARHIVDFGQNFAGRVRLQVKGVAGQPITVRHAEILSEQGELDRRNLRAARAEDRYWLRGDGSETLEPVFSYQGFRYAEISGVSTLTSDMIAGLVLSSAMPETGTFQISSPDVQKLWLNTLWSQRSNFMGIPTDCPQRDERLGWTGDAQIFWDAASFNMDVGAYTRAFSRTMRDAQAGNGAYPLWAPSPQGLGWGTDSPTPGWADAGVMLPYTAYLHSGDRTIVDENWQAMTAYAQGIFAKNPDGLWSTGRGADLGDWLALDAKSPMDATTPKALIGTAMLARSVEQIAQMAEWTGRADEAVTWRAHHDRVRSAFASAFVRADGTVGNGSHCSYILALRLNLVPQALRAKAAALLAADIRKRGTLLTTGFLGTPLALDALVDVGETQLAFDLLLRTEFPSWGYMARKGATTIWERWNGDTGDVAMNSFNHYALGAVCGFLYRRVGGIEPVEPGFARFRVAPVFDARVPGISTKLVSVRGLIETRWAYQSSAVTLELTVPTNSRADVVLPDGPRTVGPGHHRFRV